MNDESKKPKTVAYSYTTKSSYKKMDAEVVAKYKDGFRERVVPEIKDEMRKKARGAQRVKGIKVC